MKSGIIKKIVAVAMMGIMSIGLAGCGSEKKDAFDTIKEKGTVVVGLSADYAPYEYHALIDGKDEIIGFDVDIANSIADDLGVKLDIKEMEFGALIEALQQGKIDMVISGMTPKEERKQAVDFSEIYYTADQAFLVKESNKDIYKTLDDLKGKKVGAQLGSIQADIANGIEGAEVKLLTEVSTLVLEVQNGNLDALIVEVPVANLAAQTNPGLFVSEEYIKDEEGGSAIALPKESPKLLEAVNASLKKLMDEDKISEFVQKAVEQVQYQVQ